MLINASIHTSNSKFRSHFKVNMAENLTEEVNENSEELNQEEELLARHRKEKKELQGFFLILTLHIFSVVCSTITLFISTAKIQALKKSITKGDKKKKKEVTEEIVKLESELETRHEAEHKRLKVLLLIFYLFCLFIHFFQIRI